MFSTVITFVIGLEYERFTHAFGHLCIHCVSQGRLLAPSDHMCLFFLDFHVYNSTMIL